MLEFPSIGQFRDVVSRVRRYSQHHHVPLPTWKFTGRVKLHGTNASFRVTPKGEVRLQARTRLIDSSNDNYGFARHFEEHTTTLVAMKNELFGATSDIQVYGEWVGQGIQTKVALTQCPKHFVAFAVYDHKRECFIDMANWSTLTNHDIAVYNIGEIPSYDIEIDFDKPHLVQDQLAFIVQSVEEKCPWASAMFGIDGIGEGVVFTCDARPSDTDLWMKCKGSEHANGAKASKVKIVADPEKVESIKQLVTETLLPTWRLEQGFQALREQGLEWNAESTSAYLKWVCGDVMKEEAVAIEASGYDWKKDLAQPTITATRNYYFRRLNELSGINAP